MKHFTLLACDPGTTHFSFQVLRATLSAKSFSVEILHRGFIFHTVKEMKGRTHKIQLREFIEALWDIEKRFKLDGLIAERYMARGVSRSTVIETVNVMLGVMSTAFLQRPAKFIPASEWKNELNRAGFDLNGIYSLGKAEKITPHEIDSLCIGLYGFHKMLRMRGFQVLPQVLRCKPAEVGKKLVALLLEKPRHDYGSKKDRAKPAKKRRRR